MQSLAPFIIALSALAAWLHGSRAEGEGLARPLEQKSLVGAGIDLASGYIRPSCWPRGRYEVRAYPTRIFSEHLKVYDNATAWQQARHSRQQLIRPGLRHEALAPLAEGAVAVLSLSYSHEYQKFYALPGPRTAARPDLDLCGDSYIESVETGAALLIVLTAKSPRGSLVHRRQLEAALERRLPSLFGKTPSGSLARSETRHQHELIMHSQCYSVGLSGQVCSSGEQVLQDGYLAQLRQGFFKHVSEGQAYVVLRQTFRPWPQNAD